MVEAQTGPVVDACAAFQTDPAHDVWQQKWDTRTWYGFFIEVPLDFGPSAEQEFRRFFFRHTATGRVPVVLSTIVLLVAHIFAIVGDSQWRAGRIAGVVAIVLSLCSFGASSKWLINFVPVDSTGLSPFDAMVLKDTRLATIDEARNLIGMACCVVGEAIFAAFVALNCDTEPTCFYRIPTILIFSNAVWSLFVDVRWAHASVMLILSGVSFALASFSNSCLRVPERAIPFVIVLTLFTAPPIAAARIRENRLRDRFQSIVEAQVSRDVIQHHDEIMWRLIRLVAPRSLWNRLRSVASLQQAVLIDHSKKALVAVASVPRNGAWASQLVPMDVVRAIHAVFCRFDFEVQRARQHCAAIDRAMIAGDTYIVVGNLVGHGVQSRRIRRTGDSVSATSFANDSAGSPVSRRSATSDTTPAFLQLCIALRDVAKEVLNHPMATQSYKLSFSGQPFQSAKASEASPVQNTGQTLNLCLGVGQGKCWGGIHGRTSRFRYLVFGDALNDALKLQQEGPLDRSSVLVSKQIGHDNFGSIRDLSEDFLPPDQYFEDYKSSAVPAWEIVDAPPDRGGDVNFDASLRSAPQPGDPLEDVPALRFGFADDPLKQPHQRLPISATSTMTRETGGLQGFQSAASGAEGEEEPQMNQYTELVTLVEDFRRRSERSFPFDAFGDPETEEGFNDFAATWDRKIAPLVWSASFVLPVLLCIGVFIADIETSAALGPWKANSTATSESADFSIGPISTLILWSASFIAAIITVVVHVFSNSTIPQYADLLLTLTPLTLFIAGMFSTTTPTLLTSSSGFVLQIFGPIILVTGRRQAWPVKVLFTMAMFIANLILVVFQDKGSQTFSRSLFAIFSGVLYLFFAWKMCSMNRDQFLSSLLSTMFLNAATARIATREKLLSGFVPQFLLDSIARRIASRDEPADGFPHSPANPERENRVEADELESRTAGTAATSQPAVPDSSAGNKDMVPSVSKLEFRHQSVGGSFWQRCMQQPDEKMITPWGELCVASIQFHPLAFDVDRALFRLHAGHGLDTLNNSVGFLEHRRTDLDTSVGVFPHIGTHNVQDDRTLLHILAEVHHSGRDDGTFPSDPTPIYESSQFASVAPRVHSDGHRPPIVPVPALPPVFEAMLSVLDTVDNAIAEHETAYLRVVRVLGDNIMIAGPIGEPKDVPSETPDPVRRHQLDDLNPRAPDEIAKKQGRILREKHVLQAAESMVEVLQALNSRGGRTFTAALVVDSAIGAVVGDEATTIHHCILGVATRAADALLNAAPLLDNQAGPVANHSTALALETFRRTHDRLLIARAAQHFVQKHFSAAETNLDQSIAPIHLGESRPPPAGSFNPLAAPPETSPVIDTFSSSVFGPRMRWSVKKLGNIDVYPVKLTPVSQQCTRPTSRATDVCRRSLDEMGGLPTDV